MFIKVLLCTVFSLYFIGVALNAYLQYEQSDIDWDEIEENLENNLEKDTATLQSNDPFIIHKSDDSEDWDEVEYTNRQSRPKPITGKDLKLEIKQ